MFVAAARWLSLTAVLVMSAGCGLVLDTDPAETDARRMGGTDSEQAQDGGAEPQDAPPAAGDIDCGGLTCNSFDGEFCCVETLEALVPAQGVSCDTEPAACAGIFRCDSDDDCASGEVCCGSEQLSVFGLIPATLDAVEYRCVTAGTCNGADINTRLSCGNPFQCDEGVCCGQRHPATGTSNWRYGELSCKPQCDGIETQDFFVVCESDAQCQSGIPCTTSTVVPVVKVCRDPATSAP